MKSFFAALPLAIALNTASASPIPLQESIECPSIPSLQAVGVNEAADIGASWLGINFKNLFNTENEWTLVVLVETAKDRENAIKKANRRLKSLSSVEGPVQDDDEWFCVYKNKKNEMVAITGTPPVSIDEFLPKLKR